MCAFCEVEPQECLITHNGKRCLPNLSLDNLDISENRPLQITRRVVHIQYKDALEDILTNSTTSVSTCHTVKDVCAFCEVEPQECLITHNGKRCLPNLSLDNLDISENRPLQITRRVVHIQYKDALEDILTNSTTSVSTCHTVKDVCAFCEVEPQECLITHNGKRCLPNLSLDNLDISENRPLQITRRAVHIKLDTGITLKMAYWPKRTIKNLLDYLKCSSEYFVKCGDTLYDDYNFLQDIPTSIDNPLIIAQFVIYIQYEDVPAVRKIYNPYTPIRNLFRDSLSLAFHNNEEVSSAANLMSCAKKCDISISCPLIIKRKQVKVYIDNENSNIDISTYDRVLEVITAAEEVTRSKLRPPKNNFGATVLAKRSLSEYIKTTTSKNRALYFTKVIPDKPQYSHGGQSVSTAAKCDSGKPITQHNKYYSSYAHWFALKIYNKYRGDPDEGAVRFSEKFQNMMDRTKYPNEAILQDYETVYSALFSRALDRFLYPDDDAGCCIHQVALSDDHAHRPDLYVATLSHHVPSLPLLVADF